MLTIGVALILMILRQEPCLQTERKGERYV